MHYYFSMGWKNRKGVDMYIIIDGMEGSDVVFAGSLKECNEYLNEQKEMLDI